MPVKRPAHKTRHDESEGSGAAVQNSAPHAASSDIDKIDIAVRAFAQLDGTTQKRGGQWKNSQPSEWTLIFDTETTTDACQRLRLGTYQVRRADDIHERGIFYVPDDPKALSPADIEVIHAYGKQQGFKVLTLTDFVENIFFEYGYYFRGTIVGFNLPFDISRLAIDHDTARIVTITPKDDPEQRFSLRTMAGGFTFKLSNGWHPRVRIKHNSSKDALIQFAARPSKIKRRMRRGYFVDVKTVAAALLGGPFSLKKLAKELKIEHKKLHEDRHGGPVTAKYLDYAVRDTLATWECYQTLRDKYSEYGLTRTPFHAVHTGASIGKAYLKEMGIRPWQDVQRDFDLARLGAIMSAYFGGRSEVHIRKTVTRVLYCDFLSMYPSVSVLMGLWNWVTADGVTSEEGPAVVADINDLLERVTPANLQDPSFWPRLTTLVQVLPENDIFPVRAKYGDDDDQYRLALNRLTSEQPLWFTLADCIASKLLAGKSPKIVGAMRFAPMKKQDGLKSVHIAGNKNYRIDPTDESVDFYKRLIDLRRDIRANEKQAKGAKAVTLKREQQAVKNIATATTYGIFVELNVEDLGEDKRGQCYGPLGSFPIETQKSEKPGTYFHPLVAVFTTGAARLMLAIAERLALDAALDWAFCDTDSMALAKPDDMANVVFEDRARSVQGWFAPLNPYAEKGSLLKIEDENFSLQGNKATKELLPLYCYAVSPKRYVLFNLDNHGRPVIRKTLAHGLGHLLQPLERERIPSSIPKPVIDLEDMEIKTWQYCLWYRIVEAALVGNHNNPKFDDLPGFVHPAATRYGATTPTMLRWFKSYNKSRETYRNQVRPFNFTLRFYPRFELGSETLHGNRAPSGRATRKPSERPKPIAPYDRNVGRAARSCWDRSTGQPVMVAQLESYAENLAQYHLHPDSKFLNADYFDRGITGRRHVVVAGVEHIGKEADRLEPQLMDGLDPDAAIIYGKNPEASEATEEERRSRLAGANLSDMERATGITRKTLAKIRNRGVASRKRTLKEIDRGLSEALFADAERRSEHTALLERARAEVVRVGGIRLFARLLGEDPSNLDKMLRGDRKLSARLIEKLDAYFDASSATPSDA